MMSKLLENAFVSQKIESTHFYSCPQAKLSPRFLTYSPRTEGGNYEKAEKVTKLVSVLVTTFDKSHDLCTLHFSG